VSGFVFKVTIAVVGMICVLMVLGSCMRSIRISPPGLRETIQNFELLDISVRSIAYSPSTDSFYIEIIIHDEIIPNEYITLLMDALHEYFKSQQFADFVTSNIRGTDFEFLSVDVHIFGTEEGHLIHGIREFMH